MNRNRSKPLRHRRRLAAGSAGALAIVLAFCAVLWPPAARACGYHDPSQIAAGVLNWIYPKALYVRTAVWQAQSAGILPKAEIKTRDLFAYQRMAARLQRLAEKLRPDGPDHAKPRFAVVLIDSVLWSRFVPAENGYRVRVHADGPEPGDLVIVTHGEVIRALAEGSVDARRAEKLGLLRFYGAAASQNDVRELLARAEAPIASEM